MGFYKEGLSDRVTRAIYTSFDQWQIWDARGENMGKRVQLGD